MYPRRKRAPPARATNPKTGGRLTQAPAGTNPTTGQAVVFFNLEFGGHVPEVSSTSRSMASRRSVPRVVFRPVGGCGQAILSQYGFPWYAVRSTVSSGILFSLCVLVVYFHVSSSSSCVSRLERWKSSNILVVVEFHDLSELGLCVVHVAARPEPDDCPRCSSTAYRSKEESSKGLFLGDTARTDWHFGNLWLMAPDAFD